jgi:hypothetical protein
MFIGGHIQPGELGMVNEHPGGEENMETEYQSANDNGQIRMMMMLIGAVVVHTQQYQKVDQIDRQQQQERIKPGVLCTHIMEKKKKKKKQTSEVDQFQAIQKQTTNRRYHLG